jgi:raffinose/stachyose/melibiose transport system permease protein
MRDRRLLWIFVLPGLLLYGVMFVYPTISGLFYSFTDWDGISSSFRMIGWKNYSYVLDSIVFRKAFWNNVKFMAAVVAAQTIISLILALLLVKNRQRHVFLRALFFFPAILSSVSVGLIWSFVYDPAIGLLNTLFQNTGLSGLALNWVGDKRIAIYSIAAVQVWAHAGQMMIVFIAGLQGIPPSITKRPG